MGIPLQEWIGVLHSDCPGERLMRPRFPMVIHPSRQSRECLQGISSHRLFNHKIGRALDVIGAASPKFPASGYKNTPVKY
jgi:hypothetical protein